MKPFHHVHKLHYWHYTAILEYCWVEFVVFIIMSHHQHGYPRPFLATPRYRPLLPAGLQGYILYRHRAPVCRFELVVQPLLGHVLGSTGVHHLLARPYFSSSIPHLVRLILIVFMAGGYVAVQLMLCRVLPPGHVQYCSKHSCVVDVKPFLHTFSERPCSASI